YDLRNLLAFTGRPHVEIRIHAQRDTLALERLLVFPADVAVFQVIGDRTAALAQIDGAVIHDLLVGTTRLARARVVDAEPGGKPQRFRTGAEVLVKPVAAHRSGRDHADRLVILAQHFVGFAVL